MTATNNRPRSRRWLLWSAAVLSILPALSASAVDAVRIMHSGEDLRVRRYFSWNTDCSFNPTTVEITSAPSHGKLERKMGRYVLTASDVRGGSAGICLGKMIDVVELHYTASDCFVGQDAFSVRVSAPGMPLLKDNYRIEIRKGEGPARDCPLTS